MTDFDENEWFAAGDNLESNFDEAFEIEEKVTKNSTSFFSRIRNAAKTKVLSVIAGILGVTSMSVASDNHAEASVEVDNQPEQVSPLQLEAQLDNNNQSSFDLNQDFPTPEPDLSQLGQQPPAQIEIENDEWLIVRNPGLSTVNYTSSLEGALIEDPSDLTRISIPQDELAGERLVASAMSTGINIRQIQNGELVDTGLNLAKNYDQLTATGQVVIGVEPSSTGIGTPLAYIQVTTADDQQIWIAATNLRTFDDQPGNNSNLLVEDASDSNNSEEEVIELTETDLYDFSEEEIELTEADLEEVQDETNVESDQPIELTEADLVDPEIELDLEDLEFLTPEEAEFMRSLQRAYELAFLGFNSIAIQAKDYLSQNSQTPEQNRLLMQIEALATYISDSSALKGLLRGTHTIQELSQIIPETDELVVLIELLSREGILIEIPDALMPLFNYEFAIPVFTQQPIENVYSRLSSLQIGLGQFTEFLNSDRVTRFTYGNTERTIQVETLREQVGSFQDNLVIVMAMNINQSQPVLNSFDLISSLLNSGLEIVSLVESLNRAGLAISMPESVMQNIDLSYLMPRLEYGVGIDELELGTGDEILVQGRSSQEPLPSQKSLDNKDVSYQKFIDELSDSSLNQQYIGQQFEYTTKNGKTSVYTFKGLTKTGKIELKMPNSNLSIKINPSTLKARPNAIAEVEFINWDDIEFTETADSIDDIQFVTSTNIQDIIE